MKLHHPLWTHAAALGPLLATASVLLLCLPATGEFPVHWSSGGRPDRWGPAWELPLALLFASVLLLALSVAWDGLWARSLKGRFNPLSLVDELALGWFAAAAVSHLYRVRDWPPLAQGRLLAVVWGITVPLAVLLEVLRPVKDELPVTSAAGEDEELQLATAIAERRRSGQSWTYWESQNPGWSRWGIPILAIGFVALGASEWLAGRLMGALIVVLGVALGFTISGGFRVSVTPRGIRLRAGLAGWPLVRIGLDEVASAEVLSFSPLRDFGGYGIRVNREMRAYYLEGERGVKITTVAGRRVLVGSNSPERLAAVIRAAKG